MKRLTYYLILFIFLTSACNKAKKVVEETYPDGSPKIEKYYSTEGDKKEMVREVRYYPNHQTEMDGEYKNNKRNGDWVYYYQNGNKWSEGSFIDGLDEGIRSVYYENGKKRYEGYYSKGNQKGIWKFWDESGVLQKEVDYDKDTTKTITN
ncbi:MAG: hypothetical protein HGB12_16990 [Bacteroidetes bacterium]|nr:hypothetical protein [Bacteroidota bacterium]